MAIVKGAKRFVPQSLDEVVPFTGYTVESLCRVVKRPVTGISVGLILAMNGAWDNKYVVVAALDYVESHRDFTVSGIAFRERGNIIKLKVVNLGRFFADNRFKPATHVNENVVSVFVSLKGEQDPSSRYQIVVPVGHAVPPDIPDTRPSEGNELIRQYQSSWHYHWTIEDGKVIKAVRKHGSDVPEVPVLRPEVQAQPVVLKPTIANTPWVPPVKVKLEPEAILAQFQV